MVKMFLDFFYLELLEMNFRFSLAVPWTFKICAVQKIKPRKDSKAPQNVNMTEPRKTAVDWLDTRDLKLFEHFKKTFMDQITALG